MAFAYCCCQLTCHLVVVQIRRKHRLDYKEALWLGTMGGAQCLGLEKAIGSFEVGKAFDAVLLNDSRVGRRPSSSMTHG